MTPNQKIVEYVQHSQAALEQASTIKAAADEGRRKVADALPDVVDAVVASGLVGEHERQKLASALRDHATALRLLKQASVRLKAAREARRDEAGGMGEPASAGRTLKAASAQPRTYFGGSRSSHGERQSDADFARGLLGS